MGEKTVVDYRREAVDLACIYRAVAWLEALPPVLKEVVRMGDGKTQCYRLSYSITEALGIAHDEIGYMITAGVGMDWLAGLPIETVTIDPMFVNVRVRNFSSHQREIPGFVIQLPIPAGSTLHTILKNESQLGFAIYKGGTDIQRVNGVFPCYFRQTSIETP